VLDPSTPLAALLPHDPGPYAALMVTGFAIGVLGHLIRVRLLVAVGVALIFLGALLFPLLAGVSTQHGPERAEPLRGDVE
jgi:hypothetical protein